MTDYKQSDEVFEDVKETADKDIPVGMMVATVSFLEKSFQIIWGWLRRRSGTHLRLCYKMWSTILGISTF